MGSLLSFTFLGRLLYNKSVQAVCSGRRDGFDSSNDRLWFSE